MCGRLAKKEKVLKMKRENLGLCEGQCKGLLWRVIDMPLYLSMGPLKQVIAVGHWPTAIVCRKILELLRQANRTPQ